MTINRKTGTLFDTLIESTDMSMVNDSGRMPLVMQQEEKVRYGRQKQQYTNTVKIPDYGAF